MGVRFIDRLSEEQVVELHELYRGEWWTHRREVDDVRRMLQHTDVVVAFEEEDTGRLAGFARLERVLHFELYCRPELVPFYERWGFTDELGELRFMRRAQSLNP